MREKLRTDFVDSFLAEIAQDAPRIYALGAAMKTAYFRDPDGNMLSLVEWSPPRP